MNEPNTTVKPQFDIGRVISGTFHSIRQNFWPYFMACVIIAGIPQFLLELWPLYLGFTGEDFNVNFEDYIGVMAVVGVLSLIAIVISQTILQGAIIHSSIASFNNETVSMKASVSAALKRVWALIGFALAAGIAIGAGFLLLIIPGILLMLMWTVGVPALIAENKSISEAFSRSRELTQGSKRWILLLYVIIFIVSMILSLVGVTLLALFGGDVMELMVSGETLTPGYLIANAFISALIQVLNVMMTSVGIAAIYYELRFIKEGISPQSVADVFD